MLLFQRRKRERKKSHGNQKREIIEPVKNIKDYNEVSVRVDTSKPPGEEDKLRLGLWSLSEIHGVQR